LKIKYFILKIKYFQLTELAKISQEILKIFILYIYIYRVSVKRGRSHDWELKEIKENKKIFYHFANFAIVNELLIIKNRCISPAY